MKTALKHLPFLLLALLIPAMGCQQASSATPPMDAMASANGEGHGEAGHVCMKRIAPEDSADHMSHSIEVYGDVVNPMKLTLRDLQALPVHEGKAFDVVCQTGTTMSTLKSYKGVLLRDVLDKAELVQGDHKDRNFYIVAQATDDYMATFSWGELYNNAIGDSTFILFEENGAPIGANGEFVLISTMDKKTGPRHVFWLNGIGVQKVRMPA